MSKEIEEKEIEMESLERRLTHDQIKQLLLKAKKEETKYFLELSEWTRKDNEYTDEGRIEIIEGQVRFIVKENSYPQSNISVSDYLIIPMTEMVILKHIEESNYRGETEKRETVYIFSARFGWRSVKA